MRVGFFGLGMTIVLGLTGTAAAQTSCGAQHTGPGIFICYPNPSENPADSSVPMLFHISAQANAPSGTTTRHYSVFLDNRLIYDNRLATSTERLPIELNLISHADAGSHTLRVTAVGIGSAEVKNIQFYPFAEAGFCEPVSRVEALGNCYSALKPPCAGRLKKVPRHPSRLHWQDISPM